MMLDIVRTIVACLIIAAAGQLPPASAALQKASPAEILSAAAERGRELLTALREYSYYSELTIQTVGPADTITGKYYRFSRVSSGRDGNRQERVLETTSTLPNGVYVGTSTASNLTRVYQFMMTPETLNQYDLNYVGRELVDELNTVVFDVKPKIKMPDAARSHERYLRGRIWIDDQDLCVVKVAGEALPARNGQRIPKFETYFQSYDKYWFPAYTSADDNVRVGDDSTRVIVKVRFTDYKKASAKG
jgi:hypothetical protein